MSLFILANDANGIEVRIFAKKYGEGRIDGYLAQGPRSLFYQIFLVAYAFAIT
jgi:hypothetical protein